MSVRQKRQSRGELAEAWRANQPDTPEFIHGQYETVQLYSDQFVKVSQIRGERNKVSSQLKNSIVAHGLMNPIDVACMSRESLDAYIQFTNETWNAGASIDDFDSQQMAEGQYYLVIAGHSRHEAIDQAEQEGLIAPALINAKVHAVEGVWDIIGLQTAENISSVPPQERVAVAAVEAYNWGVSQGQWSTVGEFLVKNDTNLSNDTLRDALHFQSMPLEARNFVLSGVMKYTSGVELGKSMDTVSKYVAMQNGYDGTDDARLAEGTVERKAFEEAVTETVIRRANHVVLKKLNATAGKLHISAWRKDMEAMLRERQGGEAGMLDLEMATPQEQLEIYRRGVRSEISKQVGEMSRMTAEQYAEAIKLNQTIVGTAESERRLDEMEQSLEKVLRGIGGRSIRGEVALADEPLF
ncbi:MAG: hypothetical protein EOO17_03420 [Chloroflexi bacterium]|nr:MAG: hypothetical protein EOO17_03420 [Chloroflexota bacterium]